MQYKLKIITVMAIALMAIATMLPSNSNYYQDVIDLVATEHDMQFDGLRMQSGVYQNFMLFETVKVELFSPEHKTTVHAVARKIPLFDWYLTDFNSTMGLEAKS